MEKNETVCQIKQLKNDIEEILDKDIVKINKNNNSDDQQNNTEDSKNIPEKINEEVYDEKIKDVIPENKFTNYYEQNE